MQRLGIIPTPYVFSSVLSACTKTEPFENGKQLHAQVFKWGFQSETFVGNALVTLYSRCGNLGLAEKVYAEMHHHDKVTYNSLISRHAQSGNSHTAFHFYRKMQLAGLIPDAVTIASLFSAYASAGGLDKGRQLHSHVTKAGHSSDIIIEGALDLGEQIHSQTVKTSFEQNIYVCSVLIDMYEKCGRLSIAREILERLTEEDVVSWTAIIAGYAQHEFFVEALRLFEEMQSIGIRPENIGFSSALSACAGIQVLEQGLQIHAQDVVAGYSMDLSIGNSLVSLYARCGRIKEAYSAFEMIEAKDEISWNGLISRFAQNVLITLYSKCDQKLFEQMKQQGFKPNHVTFVAVLSACSFVGLVNEGLNYFKSMSEEHSVLPRPEHYICVVDILGRAGLLDHARKFIEAMPIKLDAMVWSTLLSACTIHKNMMIGEFAAQHLLELEPFDLATYVLLSNIYAEARKWDLRDKVRQMMKERGVKKDPGRSWIEIKNIVHAFFVGDLLHPLADKIYEFLEDLNKRVAEIGYVQDRYSLLHDIEQEQKDPTVFIHSEKLAVSFGLISLSSEIPIRVMKNLRVCNDCRNWMKFISRITCRFVVVRDAHHFHHFEGGVCSCGDY
ncbi:hypothetical protein MRB53_024089 [Persea americana]|uniref:Uncharacterized protein n=1 Tax=Persea americana TaxID=3435 RepID=A0ACC2LBH5_PERAE|nr:hypothetical protein MRB53_024089 [Persea americana]